ncbi:MAG: chemotaxis protein CheA, partial [Actinomycetota bacterium]
MDEIIAEFLIDSHEEVEQLDQNLVLLGDTRDTAVLNQVFRSLQTLRGTCGFLAFWHLERVAHGGEKLVGVVRQEQLDWSPEVADALLATVDKIRQILGTIERTEAEGEPDTQDLVDRLAALDDQHSSPATVATAPPTPPSPPASATMPTAASTPATSPFVDAAAHLVDPLAELDWAADDVAAIPSPVPTPEAAAPGQSSAGADLEPEAPAAEPSDPALAESVASGAPTADEPLGHPFALPAAHPAVFPLPNAEPAPVEPAPATEPGGFEPAPSAEAAPVEPPAVPAGETGLVAEAAPVEPALVAGPEPIGREQSEGTEAASSSPEVASEASSPGRIGDLLVDSGSAERTDVEIAAAEQALGDERPIGRILVDDGRTNEAAVETAARAQRTRVPEPTIGVDVALLDRLLDLVGELVHSRNQIVHLVDEGHDRDLAASAHRLDRVTSELQDGIMRTRMQPIAHEWNKLPRLVRDRSNRLGKQVRIDMVGGETELDRTVIEAIAGPLLHLVRNTVDHAIESPVDRMMAGKDPEGVLGLRAAHEGGQITIEITDDGHGIAAGPILAAAVERGFIEPEVATRLTEKQAVQLIFEPGFSTAGRVGDGTPRGAGMDVVKAGVEGIGGTVELQTEPGVGTTITLRIPLTMAIIPALTVTVGDARYAIPQANVSDLVRLDGHGA